MSKRYSTKEAAKFLAEQGTPWTAGTLEVWRCKGKGPAYVRIHNRIFYPEESLRSFAQGNPVKTIDSCTG